MIFVIDLGNTNVVYGLFKGKRLIKTWRFSKGRRKIPIVKQKVTAVVVSSVIPKLDPQLRKRLKKHFKLNPFFVKADNVPGFKVRIRNRRELGADRVVNAFAALKLYGKPLIVVDFGTATTFDVLNDRGEYEGGVITSGITLTRDVLYERTAKLPKVVLKAPRQVIGKDTVSAMQSGLVLAYAAMVEGMVRRIERQVGRPVKVVATGGLAGLVCKHTEVVDRIDPNLTLKGLNLIAEELSK